MLQIKKLRKRSRGTKLFFKQAKKEKEEEKKKRLYLSYLIDRFCVIARGHLVQEPVNPMLGDTAAALDKLLYT